MSFAALLLALAVWTVSGLTRRRLAASRHSFSRSSSPNRRVADPLAVAATLDTFSVCLSAGMAVAAAAAVTADSAPPQLAALLRRASDLLALGADANTAWVANTEDATCQALLRLARRSANSGAALAASVADLAEKTRDEASHAAVAAAERAGVLIAGPLGICFLPAFVCLGVVPVIAGLAGEVLDAGLV